MRGNETFLAFRGTEPLGPFLIPMRGNEDFVGAAEEDVTMDS